MAVAIRQKRNLGYDEWPEISSGHSPKKLAIRFFDHSFARTGVDP